MSRVGALVHELATARDVALSAAGVRHARLAGALVSESVHPQIHVTSVVRVLQLEGTRFVLVDVLVIVYGVADSVELAIDTFLDLAAGLEIPDFAKL